MSLPIFSQGLKPIVQVHENDTLFCFTIPQAKQLARIVVENQYNGLLVKQLEQQSKLLTLVVASKDSSLSVMHQKAKLSELVRVNQLRVIGTQQQDLQAQAMKLRKTKKQRTLFGIALTVVTVLAIL